MSGDLISKHARIVKGLPELLGCMYVLANTYFI